MVFRLGETVVITLHTVLWGNRIKRRSRGFGENLKSAFDKNSSIQQAHILNYSSILPKSGSVRTNRRLESVKS